MLYKAAIWDLDGTLVNTQPHISAIDEDIINTALQNLRGQPERLFVKPGQIHQDPQLCGASFERKLDEMAKTGGLQDLPPDFYNYHYTLRERIIDELSEKGAGITAAFDGAEREVASRVLTALQRFGMMVGDHLKIEAFSRASETLDHLVSNGVKIAVASSNAVPRIRGRLLAANLHQFGDNISGADGKHIRYKPRPDVFLEAAHLVDAPPRLCVGIDDSAPGVESAADAGMYVIGVVQDKSKDYEIEKASLLKHGANIVCRNLDEVHQQLNIVCGLT